MSAKPSRKSLTLFPFPLVGRKNSIICGTLEAHAQILLLLRTSEALSNVPLQAKQ